MINRRKRVSRSTLVGLAAVLVLVASLLTSCTVAPLELSGTVSDSGGNTLAGITVRVYSNATETLVATAVTNSDGTYQFRSDQLGDGTYRVRFGASDWYSGGTTWATATPVTASATDPAIANDTFDEANGSVSGTVTDASTSSPVSGATVMLLAPDGTVASTTNTGGDGTYAITGVTPGPYAVEVTSSGYGTQFYGGAVVSSTATQVEVSAGGALTGIDVALNESASITITLNQAPPTGSNLTALVIDATTHAFVASATFSGGDSGGVTAVLDALSPGTYRLGIVDSGGVVQPWVYDTTSHQLADSSIITLAAGENFPVSDVVFQSTSCSGLGTAPNLSNQDLSGRNYTGCDLSGANLTGANLSGTILEGADLTGANLSGATIDNATDLTGATIANADVNGTDLTSLSIVTGLRSGGITGTPTALPPGYAIANGYLVGANVDLTSANLDGTNLQGLGIGSATLNGATLRNADLRGASFDSSSLVNADLSGANLTTNGSASTDFSSAILSGATLNGVTVDSGTSFAYARLTGTSWTGTSLAALNPTAYPGIYRIITGGITAPPTALPTGWKFFNGYFVGPNANLSGADLHGIDLHGVNLAGTYINNTNLAGANLSGLDLSGLSLTYSDFSNANFSGVSVSSTTSLTGDRFTGADMGGTSLGPLQAYGFYAVMSGSLAASPASLPGSWVEINDYFIGPYANLTGADFSGVNLTNVNLSTTTVDGAIFATATMTGVSSAAVAGTPASLPPGWFVADSHANNERYLAGPGANLTSAVFAEIDLTNADLQGANLTNAKFIYGVNVTGVNFAGATMTGVLSEITGTPAALPAGWTVILDAASNEHLIGPGAYVYGAYSSIDFTGVDMAGLDLAGVTFYATNLTSANLSNTDLTNATFAYSNLAGTTLSSANLSEANFRNATGTPVGASTATYADTTCPDSAVVSSPSTCVGHGFNP